VKSQWRTWAVREKLIVQYHADNDNIPFSLNNPGYPAEPHPITAFIFSEEFMISDWLTPNCKVVISA
jgi:hypothetical protein